MLKYVILYIIGMVGSVVIASIISDNVNRFIGPIVSFCLGLVLTHHLLRIYSER